MMGTGRFRRRAVLSAIVVPLGGAGSATATAGQTPDAEPGADRARVLFVGDMFFDRFIRQKSERLGPDFPFLCIDPLLHSADLVVGNLEGPITDNRSVSVGTIPGSPNNYRFTFPIQTAAALLRHNVKAVSLGNNHILNFGRDGLEQTRRALDAAGVGHFGGVAGSEPVCRIDLNGVKLSFVAYNQFGGSAPQDVADVVARERAEQRVVVVFPHWGIEYSTDTRGIEPAAALFARSGAVAVIGAHPHVVGVRAKIGDTVVFYSLGNFIFDQYSSAQVMHGLAVMLTFSGNDVADVLEYPTRLALNGQTCPTK